jgi:hypothetical protein
LPARREKRYPTEQGGVRILPRGQKSARIVVAQLLAAIVFFGIVTEAIAMHARPSSATPLTIKLVPAYEECFGANSTHGTPLALPSCNPPIQSSAYLTMNAPDRTSPFNTPANAKATLIFTISCLNPGTTTPTGQNPPCSNAGDQEDIKAEFTANDIRCVGAPGQGNCAGSGGSLYNGKLLVDISMRYTDHNNHTTGQACDATTTCPGTADIAGTPQAWPIGIQCTSGNCNYITTVDLTVPGANLEGKRAVIELGEINVQDAGLNGNLTGASTLGASGVCPPACQQDDAYTQYLRQGLTVP